MASPTMLRSITGVAQRNAALAVTRGFRGVSIGQSRLGAVGGNSTNNLAALSIGRTYSTHYTESHEYAKVEDGIATVGITDFAQSALGDIVFVDLPEVGEEFEKGDAYGSVESVKAASDVYAPCSGEVIEINEILSDDPGKVNGEAESDAWFIKLKVSDTSELDDLMDADAYKVHCDSEKS